MNVPGVSSTLRNCIVCFTLIPVSEKPRLSRLVTQLGGKYNPTFDPTETTHLVVGSITGERSEKLELLRTDGSDFEGYVVTYNWLLDASRQSKKPLESSYLYIDVNAADDDKDLGGDGGGGDDDDDDDDDDNNDDDDGDFASSCDEDTFQDPRQQRKQQQQRRQQEEYKYETHYGPLSKLPHSTLFSQCRFLLINANATNVQTIEECKDLLRNACATILWDPVFATKLTHIIYFLSGDANSDCDSMALEIEREAKIHPCSPAVVTPEWVLSCLASGDIKSSKGWGPREREKKRLRLRKEILRQERFRQQEAREKEAREEKRRNLAVAESEAERERGLKRARNHDSNSDKTPPLKSIIRKPSSTTPTEASGSLPRSQSRSSSAKKSSDPGRFEIRPTRKLTAATIITLTNLAGSERAMMEAAIKRSGAIFTGGMGANNTHLINGGEATTEKVKRAAQWGVKIVGKEWIFDVEDDNEGDCNGGVDGNKESPPSPSSSSTKSVNFAKISQHTDRSTSPPDNSPGTESTISTALAGSPLKLSQGEALKNLGSLKDVTSVQGSASKGGAGRKSNVMSKRRKSGGGGRGGAVKHTPNTMNPGIGNEKGTDKSIISTTSSSEITENANAVQNTSDVDCESQSQFVYWK